MNWRHVRILYGREVRAALRERSIIVNSVLIPVFLYPFLLWAVLSGIMFVMGQSEGVRSRVVIVGSWPAGHRALRQKPQTDRQLAVTNTTASITDIEAQIRKGQVDVAVEFLPARGEAAQLTNNFEVRFTSNESREASVDARQRVSDLIQVYRADWLRREARALGIDESRWQVFTVAARNTASKKEMGAFVLGMLAPVIFVVMVAMGCFYPAVDSIAGERERNTWETLMCSAPGRISVVAAKYLCVVTFGGLAGMLNLLTIILTINPIFAPLLARGGHTINAHISWPAIPIALLCAVLLAGFVAAGMMIFASFARTFKEGQAMVTPFYMLILIPVVFLQAPGLTLTWPLAFAPIVNITLLVRETFSGRFQWLSLLLTCVVSVIMIAAALRLAAYILQFEDLVVGSFNGNIFRFLKQKAFRSR